MVQHIILLEIGRKRKRKIKRDDKRDNKRKDFKRKDDKRHEKKKAMLATWSDSDSTSELENESDDH